MLYSKAGLRVIGEFDPDRITEDLNLKPSFVSRKDENDITGNKFDSNVWGFNSSLEKTASLDDHLKWLTEELSGKYKILSELSEQNRVDIFCSITLSGQEGFSIDHKNLSLFCDLKINLEVSLIALSEK